MQPPSLLEATEVESLTEGRGKETVLKGPARPPSPGYRDYFLCGQVNFTAHVWASKETESRKLQLEALGGGTKERDCYPELLQGFKPQMSSCLQKRRGIESPRHPGPTHTQDRSGAGTWLLMGGWVDSGKGFRGSVTSTLSAEEQV